QYVPCEHRDHCGGTGEEHDEEVQRYCAEHQLVGPDIGHAIHHLAQRALATVNCTALNWSDHEHCDYSEQIKRCANKIGKGGCNFVERPCHTWSSDDANLPRDGGQRDCTGQRCLGYKIRRE